MFSKILIANRGEIAIRVARACKEMGITSVAVYSEADRDAPHVKACDEAFLIGPAVPAESYLSIEKIIQAAKDSGAEAVHPGYGFLAENADFARALEDAGIVFIGPPASAIDAMGSKTMAREVMEKAGVPIVPGATEPAKDLDEARAQAEAAGYPVACKAVGGGGGKGFRVAMTPDDLQEAFEGSGREGMKFFNDDRVYIERYLEDPRHVEVQVLADKHGNVIHLAERDCSIQRRHQKLIEEAPGPHVDEEMRERIGKIATDAARAVGYFSAGTIEGMQHGDEYFFLEMNTRVQVEHCVTEEITGVDIVREQIKIAYGEELSLKQEDVKIDGWAIECRINAEKAHMNFAPAPGPIEVYDEPSGPGVRVDSGVKAGSEVTPMYDPMVAKLIVWDKDREAATRRMLRALDEYEIAPLSTLIPFHKTILRTEQWARGETCKDLTEDKKWLKTTAPEDTSIPEPADGEAEKVARDYLVEVSGKRFDVKVIGEATGFAAAGAAPGAGGPKPKREKRAGGGGGGGGPVLASPLQGSIFKLEVAEGAEVAEGDLICVIEAMKMENEITAHKAGKVTKVSISVGDAVASGDPLVTIE
ncbi:MAG TPA: acetyl-CoA carboxylase biotin carboxylase subunit [Solirubrobacterales bacterium]|nr:acetyl-CoA carboxylase biotin carboxylase subunit [Solirubrobacterales bacterium]HMU25971.1 acetyl-CoA carboxylase biotin carboxylase subunit [Solirubrobacterales bacterium]HMX70786.1 acetyl-CoA carboxylase biotin carboxylase subunit [Solirubrobacterales bacterium]HNA24401.1 acetyl-CoA carboxylase biotin carboxylase subunit [Solirubrobacterales bacterium]HNA43652.1 acetyl-CoA carboxylase biotin carboxylase subunit [Solirubrobacterales bacterium]